MEKTKGKKTVQIISGEYVAIVSLYLGFEQIENQLKQKGFSIGNSPGSYTPRRKYAISDGFVSQTYTTLDTAVTEFVYDYYVITKAMAQYKKQARENHERACMTVAELTAEKAMPDRYSLDYLADLGMNLRGLLPGMMIDTSRHVNR